MSLILDFRSLTGCTGLRHKEETRVKGRETAPKETKSVRLEERQGFVRST